MGPKRLLTVAAGDPQGAIAFLVARLGLDKKTAREWLERGAVEVNRGRATPATTLRPGERLVVREPRALDTHPLKIVHRDEDLLVVDKPAGMLAQPAPGEVGGSLEARVQAEWPGARLMHRIDRDASGLVLFALRPAAYAAVQQALTAGRIERRYRALADGVIDGPREIRLRIAHVAGDARRRQALPERAPGGEEAHTLVTPLGTREVGGRHATLVEVTLDTGRTHQIRVHLAAIGHPIYGDTLYGGPAAPRLMLHGAHLALPHPTGGATLSLAAPPPSLLAT